MIFVFVTYYHVICNITSSAVRYIMLPFSSTPLIFFYMLFVLCLVFSFFLFSSLGIFRYGPIFRTSLVGQPVIVSTDPEVNYRVFQQEGNAFQCSYTESVFRIIGKQSLVVHHGEFHKYLKNLILKLVSPEALREKLIYEMDGNTQKCLSSWSKLGKLDAKDGTAEVN